MIERSELRSQLFTWLARLQCQRSLPTLIWTVVIWLFVFLWLLKWHIHALRQNRKTLKKVCPTRCWLFRAVKQLIEQSNWIHSRSCSHSVWFFVLNRRATAIILILRSSRLRVIIGRRCGTNARWQPNIRTRRHRFKLQRER